VKVYWERTDTYENQSPYAYLGGSVQANVNANNCGSVFVGTQGVPYKSLFCGTLPIPTSVNLLDQAPASGLVGFSDLGYASADWDLKFATLTGTFGFGNARFNQNNDTAGSASAISTPLFAGSPLSQQTFLTSVGTGSAENTYEIKLTSPSGQRLNWLVGLYNYSSYVNDETALFYSLLNNYNATQLSFFSGGDKKFSGNAIYGAIGFDVTSRLNLRAEGRQSADDYKITLPSTPSVKGHQVWNSFTPRFTATFKLTDEDNIYASAAKGFKIGGFNTSAFNTPQFTYAPETNWTYELGIKGTMLDRKLSFDTDVYYIDWTGIQVQSYIAALGGSVVVNNLGAISYGWEADTTYHFTPNLYIRASGTLLNPHYKSGTIDGEAYPYCDQPNEAGRISIGCTASVGGKQLSRTSNAQGDFAGQWTVPNVMNGYDAFVHADWSYQAGRHYLSVATNTEGDIELMNARIGLKHNNYEIDFWVKNALDYKYLERSTQTAAGAAYGAGVVATRLYPGNGRTLGGEISARW
jgi:iron complex outermembrane receptor protein